MRRLLAGIAIITLTGCVTSGGTTMRETRTFELANGSKIVFIKSGCNPREGKFINATDKNVKGIHGSMIGYKNNDNETIDEFIVSCSPAVAGGSSPCSMSKLRGKGGFDEYGGMGCPDLRFKLMQMNFY